MAFDIILIVIGLAVGAAMFHPGLRSMPTWRAMVTPLASIIGSGFLIVGPILEDAFGYLAPLGMAGLCLTAWAFGGAVRVNIARLGEGDDARPRGERRLDTLASAVLAFAYMISVAYYLNLLGSFAVRLTPWNSDVIANSVTTAVFALILITGWTRGFEALERMEYASVAIKLAIIAALLAGLATFAFGKAADGGLIVNTPQVSGWAAATLAMGLLVTVQGFETSRYLGATYSPKVRIRSMRWSQLLSAGIYMAYILAMSFVFRRDQLAFSETAIVDMMAIVAPILPILLVVAALAAQFSAAVADTSGSGGLIDELTGHRLRPALAYALLTAIGIGLTWVLNVFEIVSYASRAFAAYYSLQALIAALGDFREQRSLRGAFFTGLAVLGAMIAIFGEPAEG
ncbi:membrane protein [Oceanicola sp. 22II-s10i]|uniref:hypothetical protein n=1 Tax=Oceanicola sp. 22II-s10i TaxID=1317116 RepID=UPI000B5286F1|nr:hypothetical protein [Oceanicola sp. 22II-s10i]OWU85620.1 membrane protein [Oceanicola sp. 22II-s10i]